MHFWRFAWHYYTVITVLFHYCTVSLHDTHKRNVAKSAAKSQGNVKEFHGAGEWRVVTLDMKTFGLSQEEA